MNPYCTRIRVLLNAVHIDSLFNCAENQFFVDNSTISSSIIDSLYRIASKLLWYSFLLISRLPYSPILGILRVLCRISMLRIRRMFNLFIHQCSFLIKLSQFYLIVVVVSRLHLPSEYEYRASGHKRWSSFPKEKKVWSLLWLCILIVRCLFK